jgi:hypothetical protein
MVFQILKQKSNNSSPIINEPGFQGSTNFSNAQYVAERIVREIKTMPELVGILDTVVTDHFMDEIDFYSADGFSSLGPTQLKKAKKFWDDNNITQIFQGLGFDYFMGDAYAWHPSLKNQGLLKEFANLPVQFKELIDEEGNIPRKFSYVPASTMTIKYGLTDVEYYVQNAQGKQIKYALDEITHLKLIEFNGEVNGLSGLKALAREVAMMYMVKENILSQLDNGGSPDSIIYLKNGQGISKSKFERLKLSLESFSHVKKSHGNLAIDGEVGVHQLGMNLKDMEYRELAMFVVSEFLLAIGLPTTRVPFLMTGSGGAANKGNLAGDSEQSYQKKVNNRRRQWESILNTQVFNKLGFSFRFRRDNLQDEVRETQATQMRYASVGELQNVLMKAGKKLKESVLLDMLAGVKARLFEHDLEEMDMSMMNPMGQEPNPNKGQTPVTNPKNNVQEANSRARIDNATNRGISS